MKKYILLLILISSYSYAQLLPGWLHLNPSASSLNSIYFVNSSTGYAVGSNGTIIYTTNRGANWYSRISGSTNPLYDVVFPNALTGYVADNGGYVLKTTNGGLNWTSKYLAVVDMLHHLHFRNENTGYAVGGQNSNVKVYKTTDGGDNWINVSPPSVSGYLYGIYFATDSVGIGVGSGGLVVRTTNAGSSWSYQTIASSPILSVHFPNSITGYISGNAIWKTTNQGLNWNFQENSNEELHSIRFINKDTGYVVGGFNSIIKKTTNGGTTWVSQFSEPPTIFCTSVFPVNKDTAYICGFSGNTGHILKTTNGGITTAVNNISNTIPDSYSLYQNYPNPFNAVTKIRFEVPSTFSSPHGLGGDLITLSVFDITGREVQTLVNERLSPGTYSVDWNASEFPSGVYFYRLQAGSFTETKRMTLIK